MVTWYYSCRSVALGLETIGWTTLYLQFWTDLILFSQRFFGGKKLVLLNFLDEVLTIDIVSLHDLDFLLNTLPTSKIEECLIHVQIENRLFKCK